MLRLVQKGQIGDGLPQKISVDVALKSRQSGVLRAIPFKCVLFLVFVCYMYPDMQQYNKV
jgi:hypothetical protein